MDSRLQQMIELVFLVLLVTISLTQDCPSWCGACFDGNCMWCPKLNQNLTDSCNCNDGSFLNKKNQCISCPFQCASCQQTNNCTACVDGFVLLNGICSCPQGSFLNKLQACKPCSPQCKTCTNLSKCTSCSNDMVLLNKTCACISPNKFPQNGTCFNCSSDCLSCQSLTSCLACSPGFVLVEGSFSVTCACPSGTYRANNNCVSCPLYCKTCNGSSCLSCSVQDKRQDLPGSNCPCQVGFAQANSTACTKIKADPFQSFNAVIYAKLLVKLLLVIFISIPLGFLAVAFLIATIVHFRRKRAQRIRQLAIEVECQQCQKEFNDTGRIEDQVCPICLDDGCNLITSCQHLFHNTCMCQWIQKRRICPCCNMERFAMALVCKTCRRRHKVVRLSDLMNGDSALVCEDCLKQRVGSLQNNIQQIQSEKHLADGLGKQL